MDKTIIAHDKQFQQWVVEIKRLIKTSQQKAFMQVNSEMLRLYWNIGKEIVEKQVEAVWGSGFFNAMSVAIKKEFPGMEGFSVTNLKYMKKFYLFYRESNRQQVVDDLQLTKIFSIPWGHHILIFTKCKNMDEAYFYIEKTMENGWSRAMLLNYMDVSLYATQGKAITNFQRLLPDIQSELAQEMLKDPYHFDFLSLSEGYKERELENALTDNITNFLLELGQGFAYVGRQVSVMAGNKELIMDLLFYHLKLRCYVVIDLKVGEFEPAFIGQLGTYMVAVNHQMKTKQDNPTIGLIICKTKDDVVAEYSLEASSQPIGVSEYQLSKNLSFEYKSSLPTVEEIENSMRKSIT